MTETTDLKGKYMTISQGKSFEVLSESKIFIVRFTSDKADLDAQEVLCRMGSVHYFENGDAMISRGQLDELKKREIPFELVRPRHTPIAETLRE